MNNRPNTSRFHTISVVDNESELTIEFTVPLRYTNMQFLNAGAQGFVVSADDSVGKRRVAIKKMHKPFVMPTSAVRAFREFVLLSSLSHPNIIQPFSVFTPQDDKEDFEDVYLVMELMKHNLNDVIAKIKLDHTTLSFFTYQILCAVNHLHREGITHRDLKPSNIVVNQECRVKVLDFGLARLISPSVGDRMSAYVVTRYYRAPEVVLEIPYSEKVDVWSIGCILAELINHEVLFKGRDRIRQWTEIVRIMGNPSTNFTNRLPGPIKNYIRSLPSANAMPMEEVVPDCNFLADTEKGTLTAANARDLISRMLALDPDERYSVAQALQHPYVSCWCKQEEVNAPLTNVRYDRDLDDVDFNLDELKALIFDEVKRIETAHDVFG